MAVLAAAVLACGGGSSPAPPPGGGSVSPGGTDGGTPGGPPATAIAGGGDWAQYRSGVSGTSSIEGTWSAAQVADLDQLWKKDLGKDDQELPEFKDHVLGYTQPIVVGDTVYVTVAVTAGLVALDARSGALRWKRTFPAQVRTNCNGVKNRGFWTAPSVVGGIVYLAAPDGRVYALDAKDGSTKWSSAVADAMDSGEGEFLQSSPAVSTALGRLYIGVASSEHCNEVAGRVIAVDLTSGASQSTALVEPGKRGGGIWSSISVDEAAGKIFASTANRIGPASEEPLAEAIVRLDARTLRVEEHWQNPTQLENSDFGSSPTLFADASGTPLVAAANKDGSLYVLRRDRLGAGPVWSAKLAVIDPADPTVGGDPSAGFGSIVSATFANGLLYAAGGRTPQDEPGSVVAFDPATGAVRWKHVTPGYVIAAMPAIGDLLIAESTSPDNQASWLEVLDARSGVSLRRFPGRNATFAAPTAGRGLILWVDTFGLLTAFASPSMHP